MPIENFSAVVFNNLTLVFSTKAFLVLFLVFYAVFALILWRQIQLMSKTLPTMLSPFLKFAGILHVGVAFSLLLMVLGLF